MPRRAAAWPRIILKGLHELGSAGLIGAFACYLVIHATAPPPSAAAGFAASRDTLSWICRLILVPSLLVVLVSGLLAMLTTPAYKNAGWAWIKALSGVLVFEGTLMVVGSGARRAAELSHAVLDGQSDAGEIAGILHSEWGAVWIMMGLALANLVLGVWRPRLGRRRAS